jgi:hypothetical protein
MNREVLVTIVLCLMTIVGFSQSQGSEEIKKQMAAIRRQTNWNDTSAAQKANQQIEELSVKLTEAIRKERGVGQQQGAGVMSGADSVAMKLQQEIDDENNMLWSQMMQIVRDGGGMDLAAPLREKIAKEYEDVETPKVRSSEFAEHVNILVVNMSLKGIQVIIDQMPQFKSVTTLIITASQPGTQSDLEAIMQKASGYDLKELYIINFGSGVTTLPGTISGFSQLEKLVLFNNQISTLPDSFSALKSLKVLLIDKNPVSTLQPIVTSFKKLETLGVAQTGIGTTEIDQIKQQLPQCKVLTE